jgi:hypothetical protein
MVFTRGRAAGLVVFAVLGFAAGDARADRIAMREPTYSLELVGDDGMTLPTFRRGNRSYVLGDRGDRYTIRITNPTARRIEAVVSVDGLDVVDGESASVGKRGYLVMPFSSIDIDGFRISTEEVAAFRFSSVARSYAGRKGKARNVGVIGLAVFEEKADPVIARREMEPRQKAGRASSRFDDAPSASAPEQERPGLGTEFGEHRSSAVSFTAFERANPRTTTLRGCARSGSGSSPRSTSPRSTAARAPIRSPAIGSHARRADAVTAGQPRTGSAGGPPAV